MIRTLPQSKIRALGGHGQASYSQKTRGGRVAWSEHGPLPGCGPHNRCQQDLMPSLQYFVLPFFQTRFPRDGLVCTPPLCIHAGWAALSGSFICCQSVRGQPTGCLRITGISGAFSRWDPELSHPGRDWVCGRMKRGSHRSLDVRGVHCGRRGPLNHASSLPWWGSFSWTCGWLPGATFPFSLTARGGHVTKRDVMGCKRRRQCGV